MAERPLRYLTKSLVRAALGCPRKLVYATHPKFYPRRRDDVEDPLSAHLSREGERFGEYCRRLFPHGVEIGMDDPSATERDVTPREHSDGEAPLSLVESLVSRTRRALFEDRRAGDSTGGRATVFEGAIRHGPFYVRPDILDKIAKEGEGGTELRLIEVKSKSWDSRLDVRRKMLTSNGRKIKASYLKYVQDVAFQTMVCRLAYPEVEVSSWLMMPDRAKRMHSGTDDALAKCAQHVAEATRQTIDDSIASLINVDELVGMALSSEVSCPDSKKRETFEDAVHRWAGELNDRELSLDSFSSPIGKHCSSCEYRLGNSSEGASSGFDVCWREASGIERDKLQRSYPIVDLFGITKKSVESFISKEKYTVSDLSASDFDLLDDGNVIYAHKGKEAMGGAITSPQRQWYQVQTSRKHDERDVQRPKYVIRRQSLKRSMNKWQYPLHFVDFETISPVIPHYPNKSPYDISAFQFSHHMLSRNDGVPFEVRHANEFLHTERGVCPNECFLRALLDAIGNVAGDDGGTVFQWSPHETTVLRALLSSSEATASLSPEEISTLSRICGSMVDLCKLAKNYYYIDGSGGSSSIKKLLRPTLDASERLRDIYGGPTYAGRNFEGFQWYQLDDTGHAKDPYDILSEVTPGESHGAWNISAGAAAALAFNELQTNLKLIDEDQAAIKSSLLRYCELDTLAMAMIVQAWQGFLEDHA